MLFEDDLEVVRSPRRYHFIEVTNLIDVMIILLIFLLTTTAFSKLGVPLNQPHSKYASKQAPLVLNIDVDKSGAVFHDAKQIQTEELRALVKEELEKNANTVLVLSTDKETQTQSLFDVLDACKDAGAEKFSFTSRKK